ncbi:MAG: xylulose kinase [Spirochaetales bacterium]|nr:xylulose kinase [Spirochaetales bacterium]
MSRLSLGLDSSTQSLTAVIIDIDTRKVVAEKSLDYAADPRLNSWGIDLKEYIVPPREAGEADQPPKMFLASLDAMCEDLKKDGIPLHEVVAVNVSGQQHGHVYLSGKADEAFASLRAAASAQKTLTEILADVFSYGTAPIWKTSNTADQAEDLRKSAGGKQKMITLSGSDSPLRFTGAVMRRVGQQFPRCYEATRRVQLISSFIPAVLCGNAAVPVDVGNGCGMSLMDYKAKTWSPALIKGAARGLPGGKAAFAEKLPPLCSPLTIVGTMSAYFVEKFGFSPDCSVVAGSGDNPQTKVLIKGDLLSLGTSFVNMVATDGATFDMGGYANGMYDGAGRPFMFGCRTNGAMVWDRVRALYNVGKKDYAPGEEVLEKTAPGTGMVMWQPYNESFPPSKAFDLYREGKASLANDYPGIVDSTLAAMYLYSRGFSRDTDEPIFVTGGPASSPRIVRRIAGIWNRPVVTIGSVGAGLGTAVSGAIAFLLSKGENADTEALSGGVLPRQAPVAPVMQDVDVYRTYLQKFEAAYRKITGM